MKLLLDNP
jgi:hypothetical protein